jgi:hypothetical protein
MPNYISAENVSSQFRSSLISKRLKFEIWAKFVLTNLDLINKINDIMIYFDNELISFDKDSFNQACSSSIDLRKKYYFNFLKEKQDDIFLKKKSNIFNIILKESYSNNNYQENSYGDLYDDPYEMLGIFYNKLNPRPPSFREGIDIITEGLGGIINIVGRIDISNMTTNLATERAKART